MSFLLLDLHLNREALALEEEARALGEALSVADECAGCGTDLFTLQEFEGVTLCPPCHDKHGQPTEPGRLPRP